MDEINEEEEMAARIAQQQAMLEQQRVQSHDSMSEHELEMQRQIMSVMPSHGYAPQGFGPPGTGSDIPPPGMMPPGMMPPNQGQLGPPGVGPPMMSQGQRGPPGLPPPPAWNSDDGMMQRQNPDNLPSLLSLRVEKPDELKNKKPSELVLPKALEDVLALKDQRAAALGDRDNSEAVGPLPSPPAPPVISSEYDAEDDADSDDGNEVPEAPIAPQISKPEATNRAASKNRKKKERKKKSKQKKQEIKKVVIEVPEVESVKEKEKENVKEKDKDKIKKEKDEDVEIEYVQESIQFNDLHIVYKQFYRIFEIFKFVKDKKDGDEAEKVQNTTAVYKRNAEKVHDQFEEDDGDDKKGGDDKERLSKRKMKKLNRLSVADLKRLVARPDVVEMYDVTAKDPKLLVLLKAHRNTVQVPRHWCYKRKYLQRKRGIEKAPFDLPDFIKRTGIMEMRASLQDKEEAKTLKAKMRERARPKLGKIDIDYQKLHDAFFKWQTKPRMTIHGDLYYEGKEFETRLREKKPGDLTDELRTALGMPVGSNSHKVPPPWLIAQQRYGPPPSYPNLKIPGLNAPIPEACSFGYHAGGWGKPPVDEHGKPLYGDVFGHFQNPQDDVEEEEVDKTLWGELESESEGESEEAESEEEEEGTGAAEVEPNASGLVTPGEGLATPSGMTSVPLGLETPETIELRKKKIETEMEGGDTPLLYQVLAEKRGVTAGMMASTHVYDMTGAGGMQPPAALAAARRGAAGQAAPATESRGGAVELALDPSELEMDADAMAARYEQQLRAQQQQPPKEDLSDMLAEHVARQKNKRKRQQTTTDTTKQGKKYKEFKF